MDIKKIIKTGKAVIDAGQKLWNNGGQNVYSRFTDKEKISNISLQDVIEMGQETLVAIDSLNNEQSSNLAISNNIESSAENSERTEENATSVIEISENMTEEEENEFLENLPASLSAPTDIKEALVTLYDKTLDTIKFCEAQETKRTAIREKANVQIAQIRAQKEFLMNYMEKTFDERRSIFSKEFEVLDKALETGNTAIMAQCLNSITALAQSSPFKALTDADFSSLQSGEMILDI